MNVSSFYWNIFVAVLRLKFWFFWLFFLTTRFHSFFLFLSIFPFLTSSRFVTFLTITYHIIGVQNKLQIITSNFLKVLIILSTASTRHSQKMWIFSILSLTIVFDSVFLVVCNLLYDCSIHWFFYRWANILILVDSWWPSWLWKQLISKIRKNTIQFRTLVFFIIYLLPSFVN